MSRKTKSRRSAQSRRVTTEHWLNVYDAPKLERSLPLICGECGASGRYKVGTVTLDPMVAKSPDPDVIEEAVGFTGYFRCRKCDAGGPWELPDETFEYIVLMLAAAMSGIEDVPIVPACLGTFDKWHFRYATEAAAHLQDLIEYEPDRTFLWVRLGNLYSHAGQSKLARQAYARAIELDPKDIEAHSMLGQLHIETGHPLKAVPHFHAVLKHARDARDAKKDLRRELVRGAIESLLEAHAASNGQFDLLPKMEPGELARGREDEPDVIEVRELDLSSEDGVDELCGMFLGQRRRGWGGLFRRREKRAHVDSDDWSVPIRREAPPVGRNAPCPCGSGHKFKKCCGR